MYPPMKCAVCGRGDLYTVLSMCNAFREKHQTEILKDNQYKSLGETVNFPLYKVLDEFKLAQCCRIEVLTKDDMIASIYGLPGMDKK